MTFTIYGEDLLLGMWPWGTLWGQNLRSSPAAVTDRTRSGVRVSSNQNDMGGDNNPWTLRKRLFTTPAVTTEQAPWVTYIIRSQQRLVENGVVRRSIPLSMALTPRGFPYLEALPAR
jgi:hypothetical protein